MNRLIRRDVFNRVFAFGVRARHTALFALLALLMCHPACASNPDSDLQAQSARADLCTRNPWKSVALPAKPLAATSVALPAKPSSVAA